MTAPVDIETLRREYRLRSLDESEVEKEPFVQFKKWFTEAAAAELIEPNAMLLATVGSDGQPSVRAVLLKEFDEQGFVFYTNYRSRKSRDMAANPRVSLLLYWAELERQIRIDGKAEKISRQQSEQYFKRRPRSAQIGALASEQSAPLSSRAILDRKAEELQKFYKDSEVPCPKEWGGYRVIPLQYEFWQGRENRLHDRILYSRAGAVWTISRLYP